MHLRVRINWTPKDRQLRRFGWIGLVGFSLIGGAVSLIAAEADRLGIRIVFGAMALACGLFALLSPKRLKPIYLLMMCLAAVIGQIGVLVILPLALLFRRNRGKALNRGEDQDPNPEGDWWFRLGPAIPPVAAEWSDPGNFDGKAENIPDDGHQEE